jgi:hypothetical protein
LLLLLVRSGLAEDTARLLRLLGRLGGLRLAKDACPSRLCPKEGHGDGDVWSIAQGAMLDKGASMRKMESSG